MDFSELIRTGVTAALFGTVVAGAIALVFGARAHRASLTLLSVSACIGAISSIAFLSSAGAAIVLVRIPALHDMQFVLYPLSAVFLAIVHVVTALAAWFAIRYIGGHGATYRVASVDALLAWFVLGMQMVLLSTDVLGFMVWWEIMSIASFFLVMADREERSIAAALLYLVMTHLGAAALLAGFSVVSGGDLTGTFATIAARASHRTPTEIALAFSCFLFGFGSKAGLVPLHIWLPEAHPQAPSHVSALMSAAMLKIAVYGFLLTTSTMLPSLDPVYGAVVIGIGMLSGIFGALYAAINRDVKQTLAWSSIEHLGLIFVMIGMSMFASGMELPVLADVARLAAMFHCVAHACSKAGLFLAAGAMVEETHTRDLERMGGLARRMPFLTVAFLTLALTAAALPPFSVFVSEWMFLQGIVSALPHAGSAAATVLVVTFGVTVLISGLAVFAMVKLFAIAALGLPRSDRAAAAREPAAALGVPVGIAAALGVGLSIAAPYVFPLLGGPPALLARAFGDVAAPLDGARAPAVLTLALATALLLAYAVRRIGARGGRERAYQTWDCGQPITAGMEYTATAFSAPLRFFFRMFLQTRKEVVAEPLVSSNAFIMRRGMVMRSRSIWMEYLYLPIAEKFFRASERMKRIQSGVIQSYLILMLLALLATLIIAV